MIKLTDVSKYYRSNHNVALGLHKINLEFEIGEFVAITGESGSGKSTLLNVISGSDTYEDGEMYYQGQETSYYDEEDWENYRKEKIGFIYQNYNLIDSFTCLENVKTAIFIRYPKMGEKLAEKLAKKYLRQVGLEKQAGKKSTHLSSGQKQRLSIARALAKDTDIIVADEPTGNLDVENSRQIIEILSELAKTKLVLIVTHNYDEVSEYVTRKIRMFDGEVAEDISLRPKKREKEEEQEEKKVHDQEEKRKDPLAKKMARKIRRARPHSSMVLLLLFVFVFCALYIFLGSFLKSIDYTTTKEVTDKMYVELDDTRISVKNTDGTAIKDEDLDKLAHISYVQYVDGYDVVNDFSYFTEEEEGKTYQKEYRYNGNNKAQMPDKEYIKILDYSNTLRTASGLSQSDIKSGSLPEQMNEIVVNARDSSLVGQTMKVYISREYNWENSNSILYEMTVTGITNEGKSGQIYVSDALADVLVMTAKNTGAYSFSSYYVENGYGVKAENYGPNQQPDYRIEHPIFVINESLSENQVILSENFYSDAFVQYTQPTQYYQQAISNQAVITYQQDGQETTIPVTVMETMSGHGNYVIEVSRELWESFYPEAVSRQAAVYITDYAYMDRALKKIKKAGFDAISVLRVSGGDYDEEKVSTQTIQMGISAAALVFLYLTGIFLIRLIMGSRKKDYDIFRLLGMKRKTIDRINAIDICTNACIAFLATVVLVNLAKMAEIPYIASAVRYYEWKHYLIYLGVILFMMMHLYKSVRMFKKKGRREV